MLCYGRNKDNRNGLAMANMIRCGVTSPTDSSFCRRRGSRLQPAWGAAHIYGDEGAKSAFLPFSLRWMLGLEVDDQPHIEQLRDSPECLHGVVVIIRVFNSTDRRPLRS